MNIIHRYFILCFACLYLASCSSTSGLEEGEQLYTGLKSIKYETNEKGRHYDAVKEEVEAALAAAPNGALLGSSYYTSPIKLNLWIWNAFHKSESPLGQWITKTFGRAPVLMSNVNPALRAGVAQNLLQKHGFFKAKVTYQNITQRNPKKGKIQYTVTFNRLYTIDSVSYVNFSPEAREIIDSTLSETVLRRGNPFDVAVLDQERQRLSSAFRNSGFYFYQPGYASYLADTASTPGKVSLRLQMADSIPDEALHKWYIGNVNVELHRTLGDSLHNSITRRRTNIHFGSKKVPLRPSILLRNMPFRTGQLYNNEDYIQSMNSLSATGLFSMVSYNFTPRQSDTLDVRLNCVFDKPYDLYLETNLTGKTSGRIGPGIVLGFTKRNAFKGGETFDINLYGNYEWQTGHQYDQSSTKLNSYEYGIDASLTLPRFLLPNFIRLRNRKIQNRSTTLKASSEVINRAGFFKRHIVSGELTYRFQTRQTMHEISPLILQYDYMQSSTTTFDSIRKANPYLDVTMRDVFVPKMRYKFSYSSPQSLRNPIFWEVTLSEAANILSLGYLAFGHKWQEKNKKMFKNAFAQFVKLEVDFRKTWAIDSKSQLVAHAAGGIIVPYGNSSAAPYNEQFYVGGANSVRAFNVRTIGPGSYRIPNSNMSYLDQTGDLKLLANLEYRFPILDHLYGAAFIDAGNVWAIRDTDLRPGSKFRFSDALSQVALGTGVGLRYDLDFFVIRVDWGVGIHAPYDTGKHGYYNMPSFKDSQTLHIAVGYPF